MAYQIGFVDNTGSEGLAHRQFLLLVKTLAEANGWTTLRYNNTAAVRELILKGEGLAGDDEIFIGMRAYHDAGADVYNLTVAGFTGYVAANPFTSQPGFFESGIPAHNQRIDYWLAVNPRRVAFGLKVGTPVYEHGYAGLFLPYAKPGQYPYPLAVGGMLTGNPLTRYSDTAHSMPYKGNRASMRMLFTDGVWKQVDCWPWSAGTAMNDNLGLASAYCQARDTGGAYLLEPVTLNDATPNLYGELDGVFHVSGFDNVVENLVQVGGVDYVVMQDVARTGFNDYYALRMD